MEEQAHGKKVVGDCVVCDGKVVEDIVKKHHFLTGSPTFGPGSESQSIDVLEGYYCTSCGIYYKFPPPKEAQQIKR